MRSKYDRLKRALQEKGLQLQQMEEEVCPFFSLWILLAVCVPSFLFVSLCVCVCVSWFVSLIVCE